MKVLASGSSTGVVHQSEWNCSILLGSWVANLPSIAKTQTELPVISAWWSLSCLKDGQRYPIRFRHVSAAFLVGNRPKSSEKTWNGEQMTWDTGPDGPWPRSPVAYPYESLPLPCVTSAWNVYTVAPLLINAVLFSRIQLANAAPVLCCIITFRSYWFQMTYHAYVSYMYWMPRRRSSFYTTQNPGFDSGAFLVTF